MGIRLVVFEISGCAGLVSTGKAGTGAEGISGRLRVAGREAERCGIAGASSLIRSLSEGALLPRDIGTVFVVEAPVLRRAGPNGLEEDDNVLGGNEDVGTGATFGASTVERVSAEIGLIGALADIRESTFSVVI